MTDTVDTALDTTLDNHAASHGTDHGAAAPVLLPETAFSARRDPATETMLAADWQTGALHRRVHDACAGRPRWVLHDGPPYANGDIHMGHAVDKLFKDMLVRARRMAGYDAVLVPGWDCHGLPIEWAVEEEMRGQGRQRRDIDPATFRAACRARAEHWVARQADGFRRLGGAGRLGSSLSDDERRGRGGDGGRAAPAAGRWPGVPGKAPGAVVGA
ncbi:class I tRNA ligase family protein [Tistrella bauzanensis]|nr:class I tRNA ligase family protein [Tistrella bauzanensis]